MGLIKDMLGDAMGNNQVKTGFTGPSMPFSNRSQPSSNIQGPREYRASSSRQDADPREYRASPSRRDASPYVAEDDFQRYPTKKADFYPDDQPPAYDNYDRRSHDGFQGRSLAVAPEPPVRSSQYRQATSSFNNSHRASQASNYAPPRTGFRPLALPQVEYGEGKPFLRGYSDELEEYGISQDTFISILDVINVAVVPNPEVQVFEKAAKIAGHFVPGAGHIGLIAGRAGVGIGAALGHQSAISKKLSQANIDVFLPKGLEICIGRGMDVDAEVGFQSNGRTPMFAGEGYPEERLAAYGDLVAPLSIVLPVLDGAGRQDPMAMLGRGIGGLDNHRKVGRAQRRMAKGRTRGGDALESELSWLMVRHATPNSLKHWHETLRQSDAALAEEQQHY